MHSFCTLSLHTQMVYRPTPNQHIGTSIYNKFRQVHPIKAVRTPALMNIHLSVVRTFTLIFGCASTTGGIGDLALLLWWLFRLLLFTIEPY